MEYLIIRQAVVLLSILGVILIGIITAYFAQKRPIAHIISANNKLKDFICQLRFISLMLWMLLGTFFVLNIEFYPYTIIKPAFIDEKYLFAIGIFLSIIGLIMNLLSRLALGTEWTDGSAIRADSQIISKGPYKYIRHPQYLSLIIIMLGTFLTILSLAVFLTTILGIISFYYQAVVEEETLMISSPDYELYSNNVKRRFF